MKKYIMVRCMLLCLAVVLISGVASAAILQYQGEQNVASNMQDILTTIALQNESSEQDYEALAKAYGSLSFDYRVTILDKSGEVLGDSNFDEQSMENHADRPEIKQAMAAGTGREKRASATFGQSMLYVARRDGDIIYRIAAPVASINAMFLHLIPALLAGLALALLITPLLASSTAKSITKPLNHVAQALETLDHNDGTGGGLTAAEFDELQPIVNTINALTKHISETVREISEQKEKTEYLLNNMADGLILLDNDLRVLQINTAAQKLLEEDTPVLGKNLLVLTHRKKLVEAVQNAVQKGASTLFDLDYTAIAGMVLSVHVTAIQSDWMANGAVVLMTDVTQARQAERVRSEFVANASHELKTPITSIGGFAELLAAGVVSDPERVKDYLLRIQTESKRMAMLIEDILKLSCLENSGAQEAQEYRPVALKALVEETLETLRPQLAAQQVTVTLEAAEVTLEAAPADMAALVSNLLDNAVKYNHEGGTVKIKLEQYGGMARLRVADTGIGIPYEHQARIFERFYRVDKGRSRKIGGTGLGLSIVKHVAVKYGGEIFLQSTEGKGTTITVTLPQQQG